MQDTTRSVNPTVLEVREFHVAKALLEGQQEQLPGFRGSMFPLEQ